MSVSERPSHFFCWTRLEIAVIPERLLGLLCLTSEKECAYASPVRSLRPVTGRGTDPVRVTHPRACHSSSIGVPLSADPAGCSPRPPVESPAGCRDAL